ncbi:hypothetical protein LEN26_004425 [Aphanomyces euteiches]|nr:hypothetical protein AeMF1_020948 [Aphanomyces euteiches]KAH9148684.1 hypothetical protein LEN26_004425 [Aphanomyces euteiches]KAH9192851.1 hypothetical protein AeNC1_005167 [Aphanomyces euteiches]
MDACRAIANLRDEWANRCEEQIQALQQRIARTLSPSVRDEYFMDQFLFADIQSSCKPSLPPNLHELDQVVLQGRYFLQVVEVTNVGAGHEQRREDTPNRMLKFCLTDGYTLAFAIEYKRLNNLSATTPRGTKIIIENVQIRHGLLMLTSVVVLGASGNSELETLDAATIPQGISSSVAEVEEDKEALSDEERATDPTIRHLFYGSPLPHKEHPSLAPSRSNVAQPPSIQSSLPTATSMQNSIPQTSTATHMPPPSFNISLPQPSGSRITTIAPHPMKPFTYLSKSTTLQQAVIKAFVKSVASFDFASGMFDLKVFVEDGTRSLLVSVDPQFVETLMGVSCAVFVQAMTNNIDQGMRWVTHMQNQLSTMEGLMTIEFNSTPPKLKSCRDLDISACTALLARMQASSASLSSA